MAVEHRRLTGLRAIKRKGGGGLHARIDEQQQPSVFHVQGVLDLQLEVFQQLKLVNKPFSLFPSPFS